MWICQKFLQKAIFVFEWQKPVLVFFCLTKVDVAGPVACCVMRLISSRYAEMIFCRQY